MSARILVVEDETDLAQILVDYLGRDGFDASAPLPDLWKTLSAAITTSTSDRRNRIAIADSKRLKGVGGESVHPLRHLERGVLAALGSAGDLPASDAELLSRLGVDPHADERKPWYESETPLPVGSDRPSVLNDLVILYM